MGLSFASESLFHFHFFFTFCLAKSSNFELSEVLSLHIVSLFQFFFSVVVQFVFLFLASSLFHAHG